MRKAPPQFAIDRGLRHRQFLLALANGDQSLNAALALFALLLADSIQLFRGSSKLVIIDMPPGQQRLQYSADPIFKWMHSGGALQAQRPHGVDQLIGGMGRLVEQLRLRQSFYCQWKL